MPTTPTPTPTAFIKPIADVFLNSFGTDLFVKSTQLIEGIAPLFLIGFTIYVMLVFWDSYRHGVEENFLHLCKKFLGWFIIIALAFNATEYQKLAHILYVLPDQVSSLFSSSASGAKDGITPSALDVCFNHILGTADRIFEYGDHLPLTDIAGKIKVVILGDTMSVLGAVFFLCVFVFYLLAKLLLAMVILVGPIFIGAMLFPATRQWGMNWIGQVLNYTISVVFYVLLSNMQMSFYETHLKNLLNGDALGIPMIVPVLVVYLVATVLFLAVAWNIPHLSSALFSGATISGHAHSLSRLVNLFKGGGGSGGGGGGSIKKD